MKNPTIGWKACAQAVGLALLFVLALPLGGFAATLDTDHITKVVIAIAEPEYGTSETLPALAKEIWSAELGYQVTVTGDPQNHQIDGLVEALKSADVLVLSVRRQALPKEQLQAIREYLALGKPLLAVRTTSHAFFAKGKHPAGHVEWPEFDAQVLGGNYHGHFSKTADSQIYAVESAEEHPILSGVELPLTTPGSLYQTKPLAKTATPLLLGKTEGEEEQPVAWVNLHGKSRIFYTSLGHASDFEQPAFKQLMANAMTWLRESPITCFRRGD